MDVATAQWFRSYLFRWSQSTKYCDTLSDKRYLSGVPQGSILGPTLFKLYISPLLATFEPENVIAYVDDISIISSGTMPMEAKANAESAAAYVCGRQPMV